MSDSEVTLTDASQSMAIEELYSTLTSPQQTSPKKISPSHSSTNNQGELDNRICKMDEIPYQKAYESRSKSDQQDKKNIDLSRLSIVELRDILERQDKILSNKKFINSLPDKGAKVAAYREKVSSELNSKELVERTTSILLKLTIGQSVDLKHPMATMSKGKGKFVPSKTVQTVTAVPEKYKDTGLNYGSREKQLQELSVDESLEASKTQIEKEKQVAIIRTVEKTIRYYENIDDDLDYDEDESGEDKGITLISD